MNMFRFGTSVVAIMVSAALSGCGGATPEVAPELAMAQPGLNGGTAYPIPGDFGFAEVVIERNKPGQPVILAVYFLDSTGKQAITYEPSGVHAKLVIPADNAPKEAKLTSKPKPGKSDGKRFATEPGKYDFDELHGEIIATIDGKELTIPFAFR